MHALRHCRRSRLLNILSSLTFFICLKIVFRSKDLSSPHTGIQPKQSLIRGIILNANVTFEILRIIFAKNTQYAFKIKSKQTRQLHLLKLSQCKINIPLRELYMPIQWFAISGLYWTKNKLHSPSFPTKF